MGIFDAFRRGMIASATVASTPDSDGSTSGKTPGVADRQTKALAFYDQLGDVVSYPSHFYERPMAAVDVYPEYRQDDGSWIDIRELGDPENPPPAPTVDGEQVEDPKPLHTPETRKALDIWEQFHDKGSQSRSDLQGRYGLLMFLAGEAYLCNLYDDDLEESYWQVVSKFQITLQTEAKNGEPAKWVWKKTDTTRGQKTLTEPRENEVLGSGMIKPYRVWKPHPKYVDQADSPLFPQLDRLETIMTLGLAIRATGKSRLAVAGILYINDRILPKVPGLKAGQVHPWLQRIGKHFTTPIENPGDASAQVPIILTGSLPASEAVTHITSTRVQNYPEPAVIDHEVERVAHGLDMPAEFLTGLGGANHWTGWLLDDQQWSHVQPVVNRMVTDFQSVYYFPLLKAVGVKDRTRHRLAYDESAAVINPDRGKNAKDAHDRGSISDRALRMATGFDDDDMPSDDNPNNNPKVLVAIARQEASGQGIQSEDSTTAGTDTEGDSGEEAPPDETTSEAIAAAAMATTLLRCREIAGSRLRNKVRYQPELKELLDGVANDQVAAKLGRDRVTHLNGDADPSRLVIGASQILESDVMRDLYPPSELNRLRMLVEMHAAATLFDEAPKSVPH